LLTIDEHLRALGFHPDQIEARSTTPPFDWKPPPQRPRWPDNLSSIQSLALTFKLLFEATAERFGWDEAMRILRTAYEWQVKLMGGDIALPDAVRCAVCKRPFEATRASAKYCSSACRMKAARRRLSTVTLSEIS